MESNEQGWKIVAKKGKAGKCHCRVKRNSAASGPSSAQRSGNITARSGQIATQSCSIKKSSYFNWEILANETESFSHPGAKLAKAIVKAREEKGWNQAELSVACGILITVVYDYELNKALYHPMQALYNPEIIKWMETQLGVKLPPPPKK